MLQDTNNKKVEYLNSILETSNDLLLAETCSAILFSGAIPSNNIITNILVSIVDRDVNEGQVITARCYIAAACYS